MDYTRVLSEFCYNMTFEKLPAEVIDKTKLCLLDYIINVYGSLELEAVQGMAGYIKSLEGTPKATAHGCSFKTDVNSAAFLNGTFAEAIEAQDGYRFGGSHPGVAVIPAVLAIAEEAGSSGKEIIEAIAVGYEMANRIAASTHPWQTLSGFLPTGTCGTFGAAAGVAKLKKYNAEIFLNSVSNAGYLLPISMAEQLMGGHTIKMVQGGQAASAGIMAAGLAEHGISGLSKVLEGSELQGGFCKIVTGEKHNHDKLINALAAPYTILDVYFKPFTACRHTHGTAQAVLALLQDYKINHREVEEINIFTYGLAKVAVGKGITESVVSAQFSIPYVAAVCLLDGKLGPRQLTKKRMSDPELLALAGKVKIEIDEELNAVYPDKTSSRVEIILASGDKLINQVDIPQGDPRDPMGLEELRNKLYLFAGERERAKMDNIVNLIMNLEQAENIIELVEMI